ncbi:semaphorin 5c-like [Dermatophagoides pteronyssinus]|uniref:semaphorin 5c-like n=1 Tax=Dermatophagoides pteronyssinus TaxID=6956 RepID=UPI003F67C6F3
MWAKKLILNYFSNHIIFLLINSLYAKHSDLERFTRSDIEHYKPILFIEKDSKVFIGVKNHILVLNIINFTSKPLQDYSIPAEEKKMKNCHQKGMNQEECHNFITTLFPINGGKQILYCGTNAYSPQCQIRLINDNFQVVNKSVSVNSFSPYWNTTSLLTENGVFYYGGPLDLRGVDESIIKQTEIISKVKSHVRTLQNNPYWINVDANFVTSFQYGPHVYFLFRETDLEYSNDGGYHVVSRIGRVCTNDTGWKNRWTTFLKARLNCSLPGSLPFYLNEIQSVHYIHNDKTFRLYAIFNAAPNSIYSSAVCVFTMKSVLRSFEGAFRYQPSSSQLWQRQDDDHSVFNCQANNTDQSQSQLNLKYQLMDDAVQPINNKPFISTKQEHFKLIVVDWIETKFDNFVQVIFIATNDGKLLKYVQWSNLNELCLVDDIQLIDPKENQFLSMKFYPKTDSLYFGTVKEFIRLSIDQCEKYQQKEECIHSGDPYCGWNQIHEKCIRSTNDNLQDENFIQSDRPSCHQSWSEWFACTDPKSSAKGLCRCRKRPCLNMNNNCINGSEYEVRNCIANHNWTMLFFATIFAVILSSSVTACILILNFHRKQKKLQKSDQTLSKTNQNSCSSSSSSLNFSPAKKQQQPIKFKPTTTVLKANQKSRLSSSSTSSLYFYRNKKQQPKKIQTNNNCIENETKISYQNNNKY